MPPVSEKYMYLTVCAMAYLVRVGPAAYQRPNALIMAVGRGDMHGRAAVLAALLIHVRPRRQQRQNTILLAEGHSQVQRRVLGVVLLPYLSATSNVTGEKEKQYNNTTLNKKYQTNSTENEILTKRTIMKIQKSRTVQKYAYRQCKSRHFRKIIPKKFQSAV